jgi:hypothetical protein
MFGVARPSLVLVEADDSTDSNEAVVGRFIKNGRLVIMPSKRGKLRLVLDHIAQDFEPGRTYPEPEVNEVLERYHHDYAALRRYLVDEDFLTREGGVYWRTGGTVEV